MKKLFLVAALLLFPALARAQNTAIAATVTDPTGRFYTFLTGSASIQCPGNQQPTFNGSPLARTIPITGGDGNGHFTQVLWDVNKILPAGCTWRWAITWQDGITAFITGNIGGVTGTGPVDLSAAISAFSVPLPNTAGNVLGVTATAPILSSMGVSPVISCPTCTTSAAALTLNQLILGAGLQAEAALGSLGTTTTLLHGNAAGAPSFSAVNLAADVTGLLPVADLIGQIPISQVGSAGLSGTAPISIAATGVISCSTCATTGGAGTVTAIDKIAQSAAVTTSTLVACPASPAGGTNFLLSSNAKTTTAGTNSSTLGPLSITYTTPDGTTFTTMGVPYRLAPAGTAIVLTGDGGNITTDFDSGIPLLVNCQAGSTITYAFGYASSGVTAMVYDLHIRMVQQ